jgi:hypothetical protein
MDIIDDTNLTLGKRLATVAMQAGFRLNETRPAHIGSGTPEESEVHRVFLWMKAQDDTQLAITAVKIASAAIKHKWTATKLLERAIFVYVSAVESDNPAPSEPPEQTQKKPPGRPRGSKNVRRPADNPAA